MCACVCVEEGKDRGKLAIMHVSFASSCIRYPLIVTRESDAAAAAVAAAAAAARQAYACLLRSSLIHCSLFPLPFIPSSLTSSLCPNA